MNSTKVSIFRTWVYIYGSNHDEYPLWFACRRWLLEYTQIETTKAFLSYKHYIGHIINSKANHVYHFDV